MYNRYQGNSGRVLRVEESEEQRRRSRDPPTEPAPQSVSPGPRTDRPMPGERTPPNRLPGLSGELWSALRRLTDKRMEMEDLLLLLFLYLLYRESGDEEFLLAIGCLLLL